VTLQGGGESMVEAFLWDEEASVPRDIHFSFIAPTPTALWIRVLGCSFEGYPWVGDSPENPSRHRKSRETYVFSATTWGMAISPCAGIG